MLWSGQSAKRQCARSFGGSAFTLIEILCVVVILGIASAIAIPYLGPRGDQNATAAARVLMSDLIYAQSQAILNQQVVYVKFDTTGQDYSLLSSAPSSLPLVYLKNPMTVANYVTSFGSPSTPALQDCTLTSASLNGLTTLAFDELGEPMAWNSANGSTAPLTSGSIVVSSGGQSVRVTIQPYTGALTSQ